MRRGSNSCQGSRLTSWISASVSARPQTNAVEMAPLSLSAARLTRIDAAGLSVPDWTPPAYVVVVATEAPFTQCDGASPLRQRYTRVCQVSTGHTVLFSEWSVLSLDVVLMRMRSPESRMNRWNGSCVPDTCTSVNTMPKPLSGCAP